MNEIKNYQRKYILAAVVILFLITATLVFILLTHEPKSDPVSEKIIRQEVAKQRNKDPNELTNEDFASIKKLDLSGKNVYDIRLLRKFKNLEELNLSRIQLPEPQIPKWMIIMAKMHVSDLYKRYSKIYKEKYFIDLSPLENLSNLQVIDIRGASLKGLKPLSKVENLQKIIAEFNLLIEYRLKSKKTINSTSKDILYTTFINDKEFEIGLGQGFSDFQKPKKLLRMPKIILSITSVDKSFHLQEVELRIKREVDKAMK